MGGGEIVKLDLGICREIDRYTCMYVLEANKARGEGYRERDAARRWCERHTISWGKECASMRSMKRGGGVCTYVELYWT